MPRLALVLFVVIVCAVFKTEAQDRNDSISIQHGFRMTFVQHDTIYSKVEIKEIVKQHPEAYQCMRTSVITANIGTTMRFLGSVLIFLPVANKLEGKTPNWKPAGIGLAVMAASLPFSGIAAAKAERAIAIFNSSLVQLGNCKLYYQFGITDTGAGINIKF